MNALSAKFQKIEKAFFSPLYSYTRRHREGASTEAAGSNIMTTVVATISRGLTV